MLNVSFDGTDSLTSEENDTIADWGPRRDSLYIVVPLTVLYILIFFTGLVGNICTCIVISRNRSMHTTTNYYLFSLAISDLLLLISGLPQEIYGIWSKYPYVFGELFCILRGLAAETSANATVLTITAFTVERYVAICHPFLSHTISKLSRALKLIIIIWLFAISFAIPQAMALEVIYETDEDHSVCNIAETIIPHAFEISTFFFFVAPMSLITVLYILIAIQLRRSHVSPIRRGSVRYRCIYKSSSANSTKTVLDRSQSVKNLRRTSLVQKDRGETYEDRYLQGSKHVIEMLVAVVVAFFICWAPFHAQRLLAVYGKRNSSHVAATFSILTYISGILYYLSTTINPVLYHIMSRRFRLAFKDTLSTCIKSKKHRRISQNYLSAPLMCNSNISSHQDSFKSIQMTTFSPKGDRKGSKTHNEKEIKDLCLPNQKNSTKHILIHSNPSVVKLKQQNHRNLETICIFKEQQMKITCNRKFKRILHKKSMKSYTESSISDILKQNDFNNEDWSQLIASLRRKRKYSI